MRIKDTQQNVVVQHYCVFIELLRKGAVVMVKVKMLIQTQYKNELFRADKVYEVNRDTAERWHQSKIAIIVDGPND